MGTVFDLLKSIEQRPNVYLGGTESSDTHHAWQVFWKAVWEFRDQLEDGIKLCAPCGCITG